MSDACNSHQSQSQVNNYEDVFEWSDYDYTMFQMKFFTVTNTNHTMGRIDSTRDILRDDAREEPSEDEENE